MDNYLMDREALGQFVDQIMEKKTFPDKTPEEINAIREENIKALDDKISLAIFSSLSEAKLEELNEIFDRNEESPEVFTKFFEDAGVDLKKVVGETAQAFGIEMLGGENV